MLTCSVIVYSLEDHIMKKILAVLMTLVIVLGLMPNVAIAAAGDVPAHDKILTVNDDGTYTIALNVTGDSQKQITKVNVIVIVDRSGSMDTQSGTGAYVASNQNGTNMYGFVDGEYVALTRTDNGYWANPRYTYTVTSTGESYTGQRYQYDGTATRLEATKAAVNGLASTLLGYNGKDGNPNDTVEMALVSFATSTTTNIASTTSADSFVSSVNGLTIPSGNAAGTNWESALQTAKGLTFNNDGNPTYVIFFSDGAPTFYLNANGSTAGSGYEQEPNMENSYNAATDDAAALATQVGVKNFYTIFAYGSDAGKTYMTNLTAAAGAPATNNYSAANTAELNDAFAAILEDIEMAGIGAVSMQDGTTSSVTTTSGEVSNLLTVDTHSYKYYRAGGAYSSTANNGLGDEWADAPEATFEGGAVKWDLKDEGVLENGVTYTVTFNCWPSQTTLDIAADIKNDPSSYNSLDANIKNYINPDGSLKTNTTASISYTDTRTGESNSEEYENPDPVATSAVQQMAVSKEWENALDGQKAQPITLTVTRDNKPQYTMRLGELSDPNDPDSERVWTDDIFISVGILRHSDNGTSTDSTGAKYEVLEMGHEFTFVEPTDLGYYWELQVPTVRPMLIDGTVTMLILKETDAPYNNPENTTEYTVDGKTYYVGKTGNASLTAVNHRRARLNITKVVNGEDADPNQTFPFTVTVNDSKASEGTESNLNSDYWVWFSIWNGGPVDCVTSEANKEYDEETGEWTGYYYVKSGTAVNLNLKASDNLRFLNLPTDTTYTITEGTLADGYVFRSAVLSGGTDDNFSGGLTSTGTIVETEKDYTVTYTNLYQYARLEIPVTKVLEVPEGLDGPKGGIAEKYEFTLAASGNAPMPATGGEKVKNPDANGGKAKFGEIVFMSAGTYTYTVTESGSVPGVNNDASASNGKTVTVSVVENEDGTLTATTDGVVFTNTYSATGTAQIPVIKNVTDNDNADDITGKFTFTLAGTDNAPMPTSTTVTSGKSGDTVQFGEITYSAKGSYSYTVTESYTNGESYDTTGISLESSDPRTVSVVVTDDGEGKLTAVVNGGDPVTFNNPYSVKALDIVIPVKKILDKQGLTGPDDITGKFTFTLTAGTNTAGEGVETPMPEENTLVNPAVNGGTATFGEEGTTGKITVIAPGTYTSTVTESGSVPGVTNDANAEKGITFDVVVIDNNDGTMSYTVNGGKAIEFTNTYSVEPTTATIYVKKVLEGENAPDITEQYSFTLAKDGDAPMPETATVKNPNADGGITSFAAITYSAPGTYNYTITESGEVEGVVNDANASDGLPVTVTVTDNGDGTLKAVSTSTDQSPVTFTNSYHETTISIPVTKTLKGAEGKTLSLPDITGKYTFTLTGSDGAPMPETTSYTNPAANGGNMTFGGITFKSEGTFTYTVTETNTGDAVPGVTNDATSAKSVTVSVTRNDDGSLTATFSGDSSIEFVNTYDVEPVTVSFPVKKVISKPDDAVGPEDITEKYTFTLKAEDGAPMPASGGESVKNPDKDGGVASFGEITYTAPGTYTYTVTESGSVPGVTNQSPSSGTVTVTVTDNSNGTMTAVASSTDKEPLTFTNSYNYSKTSVVLQVNKTVDAPSGVTAPDITGKYTFTLAAKDGAPMPESGGESVKNPAADGGTAEFGKIEFIRPGTYTYTVTESGSVSGIVNDSELTKTVTVKVVDGKNGELVPTIDYGNGKANVEFVNSYEVVDVTVTKTWDDADDQDGYRPDTITVNLLADGTKADSAKVSADKDGKWAYTFKNVPKYGENAKVITYTVTEEKVDQYETTISGDAGKGFTITNKHTPEETSVTITKKWSDNDNQDGFRLTADAFKAKIHLLADGTEVKDAAPTVKDNGDGTYTVTYTGLPKKANGKDITYKVKEDTIDKYTANNSEVANGGTITNTHSPEKYKIKVTKIWVDESNKYGLRPESVKFTVTGDDGKTYDVTLKGTGDTWTAEIEVLKYRDGGKEVKYTVDEEKITAGYAKKIEDLTITNTFKPCWGDPPVKKELKGDKPATAETFKFKLTAVSTTADGLSGKMPMPEAANGAQEMTIDVKAGDTKEFGKFDLTVPGVYTYTITEVAGSTEGYTYSTEKHTIVYNVTTNDDNSLKCVKTVDGVEITGDETDKANVSKFTITNTYTKPEEIPPTGDTSNIFLWGGVSVASLLGLVYMFMKRRREEQ